MNTISVFDKLKINLKREYWEYRRLVWGVPIIMSILFVLAAMMAIAVSRFADDHQLAQTSQEDVNVSVPVAKRTGLGQLDKLLELSETEDIATSRASQSSSMREGKKDDTEFSFIGLYLFVAWLTGFYYLLSCLYTDRRDKSVLYWKSLPVSETENVVSKLLFGTLGFSLAAIVMAWLTAIVLFGVVHGLVSVDELAKMQQDSNFAFDATPLFIWPALGLIFGLLWGAPVFAYVLMVSAMSKRLPFMLLVLPPFILLILEGIFFSSSNLVGFMADHTPAKALMMIARSPDSGSVLATFFGENGISLILGLLLAAVFLTIAVWCRNKRFEI